MFSEHSWVSSISPVIILGGGGGPKVELILFSI